MKISKNNKAELANKIEDYLSGRIDHESIKSYAWKYAERSPKQPPDNDKVFWNSIFSIIHLADDEHWSDECTQKELSAFIFKLNSGSN